MLAETPNMAWMGALGKLGFNHFEKNYYKYIIIYKWEIPVDHFKALGACCLIRIAMNFKKLNTFYGPTLASNVQFLRSQGRKWKSAYGIKQKWLKQKINNLSKIYCEPPHYVKYIQNPHSLLQR